MAQDRSALFCRDQASRDLTSRLQRMPGGIGSVPPNPEELWAKLLAAEAETKRKLGILLQPTEVFPVAADTADVAALPAGMPYIVEPAYDMPPDWLQIGSFGALKLNNALVTKVTALELRHPSFSTGGYKIPAEWVHITGKAGLINVLPGVGNQLQNLPLGVFTLQVLSNGYTLPHAIRIRYTAGLTADNPLYPEIVDLTIRAAAFRFMLDAITPQSSSISSDGLSQSQSQDLDKQQGSIDAAYDSLHDRLKGPVWGVL